MEVNKKILKLIYKKIAALLRAAKREMLLFI
jgi:hypothetical protein